MYVRIDSIEQAIRASAIASPSLDDVGYRITYGVAERNLRIDRVASADPVNPLQSTRDAWLNVATGRGQDGFDRSLVLRLEPALTACGDKSHRYSGLDSASLGQTLSPGNIIRVTANTSWSRAWSARQTALGRVTRSCRSALVFLLPRPKTGAASRRGGSIPIRFDAAVRGSWIGKALSG